MKFEGMQFDEVDMKTAIQMEGKQDVYLVIPMSQITTVVTLKNAATFIVSRKQNG